MKPLFFAMMLALSFSGTAFAGDNGEICAEHKVPTTDVTSADAELAKQAAQSMIDQDRPRPDGKLTPAMRSSLEKDSANITKTLKAKNANNSCCASTGADCCKGAGKTCCAKNANALSVSGALDGATTTMKGQCPGKKH